jgi:hypothetical protein
MHAAWKFKQITSEQPARGSELRSHRHAVDEKCNAAEEIDLEHGKPPLVLRDECYLRLHNMVITTQQH